MSNESSTAPFPTASTDLELRVLIRGLKLDDNTQKLIDAAIRSTVLQEVAAMDHQGTRRVSSPANDLHTRSLNSAFATKILGLIVTPT